MKGTPKVGEEITLTLITEGHIPALPDIGEEGKALSMTVKKVTPHLLYLLYHKDKANRIWVVVPKK